MTADAPATATPWWLSTGRAAAAALLAGALTTIAWRLVPGSLEARTDIVGYPTFANFNVDRYLWRYGLVALFFPLAAVAFHLLLARLGPHPTIARRVSPAPPQPPADAAASPAGRAVTAAASTALTGAVLGAVAATSSVVGTRSVLWAAFIYAAAAAGAAAAVTTTSSGRPWSFLDRVAAVNALAAPLAVFGLYGLSAATEVRLPDGSVREYAWLSLPAALVLAAVPAAVAIVGLARARDGRAVRDLERRLLVLATGPVLLYVLVAYLPGALWTTDFFHEGEPLAAARLVQEGAVPWRDVIFIHGLIKDVAEPLLGLELVEQSVWGYYAGVGLIVTPAYWLGQYFLAAYLFRDNLVFFAATQVAAVLGVADVVHVRFALMPYVLLLLAALLRRATVARGAALGTLLTLQAVVSPETAYAVPACVVVLAAFELQAYERTRSVLANFRRTVYVAVAGSTVAVVWFVALAAAGVLDDFLFFYRTFAPDHELTGGIPVRFVDGHYGFAAVAPVVLVILTIWYFAVRLRLRHRIPVDDWVMASLTLLVGLYYVKFLSRADQHVYQVFAVTVPLFPYVLYRLLTGGQSIARRHFGRSAAAAAGRVLVALATIGLLVVDDTAPVHLWRTTPVRFAKNVDPDSVLPRIGYARRTAVDVSLIRDLRRVVDERLAPEDELFDFTNSPGLFHFVLQREPATRYYHVSMAVRRRTQLDLIEQLERSRPRLVVFSGPESVGLPSWDGIANQVRHYEISSYLLARYRPVAVSHGFVFMQRAAAEASTPAAARRLARAGEADDLYFRTAACDWGFAPNFLSVRPDPGSRQLALPLREVAQPIEVRGWAIDRSARAPAPLVVATAGRRVVARAVPDLRRPDVAATLRDRRLTRSGFVLTVPASWRARFDEIRLHAITRSGVARPLLHSQAAGWMPPAGSPPALLFPNGKRVPVVEGPEAGYVDGSSLASPGLTLAVDLPPRRERRRFEWLELRAREPFGRNAYRMFDVRGRKRRAIAFRTLEDGQTSVFVRVGACSQWHGYRARRLFIRADRRQSITEVRLVE